MRRDFVYRLAILTVALAARVSGPWQAVFGGEYVDFLETDAWYHVRLIENQVRNWPWRVTVDPYAAPEGQFVPIAPFFDTLTSTAVLIAHGRDASVLEIERLAAVVPPVLGVLTVAAIWLLAARVFDRRAALMAAALLAILPGHFLDRTQLGFYDHHALEALLAVVALWAIALAIESPADWRKTIGVGAALGLYLLAWGSGAFFLAIIGAWLVSLLIIARASAPLVAAGRVTAVAAIVALVLVLIFQDARMFRYESQLLGLTGLAAIAGAIALVAGRLPWSARSRALAAASIAMLVAIGILSAQVSGDLAQVMIDVRRLTADPNRMGVLEARPLFLYSGAWDWSQPWTFFRGGFYLGLVAALLFTARVVWRRRPIDLLLWIATLAMFVATYGQNRFGYYLVPLCALLAGWLASDILARSDKALERSPGGRMLATVLVVATMIVPNVVPASFTATRAGSLQPYWHDAIAWLGEHTPPPFPASSSRDDESYYYARYPASPPAASYSVMNWWDHGYWVEQIAHRVPVANPTQARAGNAARFYAATSEADALQRLAAERSRYVISDWELPFRYTSAGAIMGRFQNVVDWAGARHADYYEVMYRRSPSGWIPVWVFFEPYYRSMTFRLSVLGGAAASPSLNATSVIVVRYRVDPTGLRFREIESDTAYSTYAEAVAAAQKATPPAQALVVGLDPWRTAFPLEALTHLREIYAARTAGQPPSESPWVRIFAVTP